MSPSSPAGGECRQRFSPVCREKTTMPVGASGVQLSVSTSDFPSAVHRISAASPHWYTATSVSLRSEPPRAGMVNTRAAIVITAAEDDLLPVRRPVCTAHEAGAGVGKPQRLFAADQLHVKIAPAPVFSVPDECDLFAVWRKCRRSVIAWKAGELGDAHVWKCRTGWRLRVCFARLLKTR